MRFATTKNVGLVLLLTLATFARAADAPTETKTDAPDAKAILAKAGKFYSGIKTLTVLSETRMNMNMQGMDMNMSMSSEILAARPNKLYSKGKAEGMLAMMMGNTMVCDGKKLYLYMPSTKKYVEEEAPKDFSGFTGKQGGTGGEAFLFLLLGVDAKGASYLDGADQVEYLGQETLNGQVCHHIRAKTRESIEGIEGLGGLGMMGGGMTDLKVEFWVDAGEQPFIRRVAPDISGIMKQAGEQMGGGKAADPDAKTCQQNLIKIDGAKEQFALENNKRPGVPVAISDIVHETEGYLKEMPVCPSGKKYVLNPIGENPICLSGIEGHSLEAIGAAGQEAGQMGEIGDMMANMKLDVSFNFLNYKINEPIADEKFAFVPPDGSSKVDSFMEGMGLGDMNSPLGGLDGLGDAAEPTEDDPMTLIGKAAPTFKLPMVGGGEFDLASRKGKKIVLLDFWATWCGPCRKGMPDMISVAKKYADKDVELVAVNLQEKSGVVSKFLVEQNLEVDVALDLDGEVATQYKVGSIPMSVIIDKEGIVRKVHIGLTPSLKSEIAGELDEILKP